MVRTLLIVAAAGIVLSVVTLGGAAVLAGPEVRNGWYWDPTDPDSGHRGAPDGPRVERTLEWTGGDSLTVALPADVIFTQGDTPSVRISAPQEIAEGLTLVDGRLAFDGERDGHFIGVRFDDDRVRIWVTAPDVSRFVIEGSGDLELRSLDLAALSVEIAGSGDVEAHGHAESLTAAVRGSGDADLDGVTVQTATLTIDGSGEVSAHPVQSAEVRINGSGDVTLTSSPASMNQVINGSGDVRISRDGDDS